ncbi:HAMP domain-containing sensor histidine kinase [Asanoa iriomotensis]|uniref:histidine kinase n=2 Tax=Asanoa iriomotensis TaxID=234613 RepID=A0ABQ4C316_9ACTN|nr:two-component sensor histidine kinase [Asanoa iriomotensis]
MAPLRGTPLRVKLVAAVLALVTAALLVIGAASTFFLRNYLLDQVDGNLRSLNNNVQTLLRDNIQFAVGDNAFAVASTPDQPTLNDLSSRPSQLFTPDGPDLPQNYTGLQQSLRQHQNDPYTIKAIGSQTRWRVLMVQPQNSTAIVVVGYNLADVDHTVKQLLWIDGLAGGTVLIVLATLGAAIVRSNLKPLRQIERTTVAIAAGDLSQRVPDPEPGVDEPKTELGRLSRALNTMLTQIETAFAARAESEAAARDAAFAAQASESRALRSEERMRQFVADASHELRTPLTSIRGFAELYRQGAAASPGDTARLVRRIEDEAARMGLLVEDLLLLARLDRERPLSLSPVELRVLASEAVQAAQAMAPERDISIEVAPRAGLLVVRADDARLRQVLGNLLTNAIIHTPADAKITVRLRSDGGSAIVEVVDTGQGLPPEQAERVFERFYRADAARRRDREANSTGLGLAIVAALVRAHGGTVEVDSVPGHGSTFRVRLPLAGGGDDDQDFPDQDGHGPGGNGAEPHGHSQTTLSPAPGGSQSGGER